MTEIIKKGKVENVVVDVWPDWKDTFKSKQSFDVIVPAAFYRGEKWELTHTCNHCGNQVAIGSEFGNENYIAGTSLHIAKLQDRSFLDQIGSLFALERVNETDENNAAIYYYYFPAKALTAAWFNYYKCRKCNTQYMMCYTTIYGKERPPEPDEVYLIAIAEVAFDEEAFLKNIKTV